MAMIGLFFRSVFGVDCSSGGFRVSTGTAASGVEGLGLERIFLLQ